MSCLDYLACMGGSMGVLDGCTDAQAAAGTACNAWKSSSRFGAILVKNESIKPAACSVHISYRIVSGPTATVAYLQPPHLLTSRQQLMQRGRALA